MDPINILHFFLLGLGALVCVAGSIGIYRFPNTLSRIHALTKVDNAGLGLVIFGVAILQDSWIDIIKLVLIWVFILISSATCGHLIARHAHSSRSDNTYSALSAGQQEKVLRGDSPQ